MSKRSRGAAMLLAAGGSLPEPKPSSSLPYHAAAASPCASPASKRGRDSSAVPQGSPSKQPSPAKGLPEHLQRLQQVFELMLSGRGLLKRRAEKITVATLAPIVESVTKRDFKVEYVQQIKFLYPEAYDWRFVRVPSEHEKNKLNFHLLLQFERCTTQGGASQPSTSISGSLGRVNEAAERAELLARAAAWYEAQQAEGAPPDTPVPCAPLPPKDHTSLIIGGSPMQAQRRMSTSPAHLRNSLALQYATSSSLLKQPPTGASPTLHRAGVRAGSSPTQQQQRQQATGVSPTAHRGVAGASPATAAQGEGHSPAAPCSTRPGGGISNTTSPASSRLKQRPRGPGQSAALGGPDTVAQGSPGGGKAAGEVFGGDGSGNGGPYSAQGAGSTPRVARRKLQLGGTGPALRQGADGGVQGEGSVLEQGPQQQGQGQQQQGASGSHAEGGGAGAEGLQVALALDDHVVDMSAFDEPMTVQVQVQSVNGSPATPASQHEGPGTNTAPGGSRRSSMLSKLMSPQALEALQRNAVKAQQSPALKAEAELLQSQRLLPQAMDLVRAAFGPRGPVMKQREELVELMRQKSSLSIALSTSEAARALQLLLQHAPEMLKQEQQGNAWVIRLCRTVNMHAVRMRLCSIASQASKGSTIPSLGR